jgi:hypothetical protein
MNGHGKAATGSHKLKLNVTIVITFVNGDPGTETEEISKQPTTEEFLSNSLPSQSSPKTFSIGTQKRSSHFFLKCKAGGLPKSKTLKGSKSYSPGLSKRAEAEEGVSGGWRAGERPRGMRPHKATHSRFQNRSMSVKFQRAVA